MNYQVTINGQMFNVTVEPAGQAGSTMPAAPVTTAPVASAPAAPAPVAAGLSEEQVASPMSGNIWAVKVAVGERVTAGQPLVVLEAMKMENDIVAPRDGIVKQVLVTKGTVVEANDILVVLS